MLENKGRVVFALLLAWLALEASSPAALRAHEIPNDVTAHIIVKPSLGRLEVLVRVPLEAMQDMNFPTFGPGYLDIARADSELRNAARLWLGNDIELYENARRLQGLDIVAIRASIPSDRSFTDYERARAHLLGAPLDSSTELIWQQALLDVLFEVPMTSERSEFSIRPGLERLGLRVITVIRFVAPDGDVRLLEIEDQNELVPLDPSWYQASLRFVSQGFVHILDGVDHLLFLLCLVVPLRRSLRGLVWVVTAFTVAHSVTLVASAYGLAPDALWFPPLVETLIAASIFYMAIENIVATRVQTRWAIAFGFGLIHGFGFSFALRNTLQFAGDHVLASLLSFNLGVELGQLLVLVLLVPLLNLSFRWLPRPQIGVIVLSVIVAHTAWHWMSERFAVLREFPLGWAELYTAFAGSGLPWLALGLLAVAVGWRGARRLQRVWSR